MVAPDTVGNKAKLGGGSVDEPSPQTDAVGASSQAKGVPSVVDAKLPTCIPVTWTDARRRYHLAYPRSPWDARRYLICRLVAGSTDLDTQAVVDDHGNLVETHCRDPRTFAGMGFMRLQQRAAA